MTSLASKTKTEHLILLVGGNPLPNAVAGKLLVSPNGTITLVHSGGPGGTADVAQRLRAWFTGQGIVASVELKEVEESSPTSVIRSVQERLGSVNAQSVGLNYTGGTKAMSVHAYRAVEQWAEQKGITAVFSYLDARTLQMVFDPVDAGRSEQREYVGRALELKLTELLVLHDWSLTHPATEKPILPRTAQELLSVHAQEHAANLWVEWLRAELFQKATRREQMLVDCPRSPDAQACTIQLPTRKWLSQGKLKNTLLQWPSCSALESVTQRMKTELLQADSLQLGDAATTCGYTEVEDFCKWLDGGWLESAVLATLQDGAHECGLHEVAMNLKPTGPNSPKGFEFDVVGIRGYQLFAFSCSTDTENVQGGRDRLKKKLFEAYIRASQLGGDEARVALVCCSNDPDGLEHEMRRDVDPEGRIRVFGRKHLADLATHLKQWIQSQSGEE